MKIERMQTTDRLGRPRAKYLCDYGHWHPTFNHALKCHERHRRKDREKVAREMAKAKEEQS